VVLIKVWERAVQRAEQQGGVGGSAARNGRCAVDDEEGDRENRIKGR